jgi:hypothetical protein
MEPQQSQNDFGDNKCRYYYQRYAHCHTWRPQSPIKQIILLPKEPIYAMEPHYYKFLLSCIKNNKNSLDIFKKVKLDKLNDELAKRKFQQKNLPKFIVNLFNLNDTSDIEKKIKIIEKTNNPKFLLREYHNSIEDSYVNIMNFKNYRN